MKNLFNATVAALLVSFATPSLAGYADDRAEIENLSNRYMVAVDAGDIETVMSTWAEDGVLEWVLRHGERQGGDPQGDVRLRRRARGEAFRKAPRRGRARATRSSTT